MTDEEKGHGEASGTGETEASKTKPRRTARAGETTKEEAVSTASTDGADARKSPAAPGQPKAGDAAKDQSKTAVPTHKSQAERMRFRRTLKH